MSNNFPSMNTLKRVEIQCLDKEGKEPEGECRSDGGAVGEDLLMEHCEFTGANVTFDTSKAESHGSFLIRILCISSPQYFQVSCQKGLTHFHFLKS